MPTKSEELKILDGAIAQLGDDSYLGPWLKQIKDELAFNLRSDYLPEITLKGASQSASAQATEIVETAKMQATKMIADAQAQVGKIKSTRDYLLQSCHSQLRGALAKIEGTI